MYFPSLYESLYVCYDHWAVELMNPYGKARGEGIKLRLHPTAED